MCSLSVALLRHAVGCTSPATTPSREPAAPRPGPSSAALDALPAVRDVTLTVSNLRRSVAFFEHMDFVLDGERDLAGAPLDALLHLPNAAEHVARLHLGTEHVELRQFAVPGRPISGDARNNDATFQHMAVVVSDIDAAFAAVLAAGAERISPEPQTIPASNPAAGGIRAAYFHDADLHDLELIWFPAGKGRPRWQERHGVFLGVDHTAIAVARTEPSRGFYESLAFSVGGKSYNFGPEQEALSGVPGARVRITSLVPEAGPSIEFLSYEAPKTGRGAPSDSAANDVWRWEVTIEVADLDAAVAHVMKSGGRPVSSGPVDVGALGLGYAKAVLVEDPDGHALRLVSR